jgi:glucose/arabinose dehydrogenase
MKKLILLVVLLFSKNVWAQTPIALYPDINISKVMTVRNNVTRLCYSNLDSSFYYLTYDGEVYKIVNQGNSFVDTLLYNISNHGIETCQGMVIQDSSIYISGNNGTNDPLTVGKIMKGALQPNNTRVWSSFAETVPYETAQQFDHFFSGLGINSTGDTILICSGSRGDHGEVKTNGGLYPNLRNLAITSVILQIPTSANGIVIPNDSVLLDNQGLVYARGIRNTYDFAFNASGDLFGAENSGDRDMEDELNYLQRGHHYGFPWMMGGTYNPQQYSWFNPAADLLINHQSGSWNQGAFYNDPDFPQTPVGLVMDLPCKNLGLNAAYMRDSATGITYNAAANGEYIYSFTPHRSPLGLVFDNDSLLDAFYNGNGFVLSYTKGDSTLAGFSKLLAPFGDDSEDITMLKMIKDSATNTYSFIANRIVYGFDHPIDAVMLDTSIYVIEIGYAGTSSLWKISLPKKLNTSIAENNSRELLIYPNPVKNNLEIELPFQQEDKYVVSVFDINGRTVYSNKISAKSRISVPVSNLANGTYIVEVRNAKQILRRKFEKQ